jgi:hypothetical protein
MTRSIQARRARALAATTAAGLALGTLAVAGTTGTAVSAEPAPDCATPYDASLLQRGDAVTGLTVEEGTTPEAFTGEVIGVLDDGIAAGLDMIMVELDSEAIARAGGIWQGMSGSPVYVGDQLLGAVAYGLSWGPSPIAGITPFSEMDDYLGRSTQRPAASVEVSAAEARTIARASDVSRSQAEQGFAQLPVPMGVTGLSSSRLAQAQRFAADQGKGYLAPSTYAAGRIGRDSARAAAPESVVAGGNIAASISYGDVTYAGVGTVTSVCDGEVVGFGHPFNFLGATTLGLHPADALYVQPDSLGAPFKVANIAPPTGTIDNDRLTGISGVFGTLPDAATITSTVTYGDRSRTGSSDIYYTPFSADVTFGQQIVNHDRVVDGITAGGEDLAWTIEGTDETGAPFTLSWADRYISTYDITFEASWDLADTVYNLSQMPDVSIESITVDGVVDDDASSLKLVAVEQLRDGEWTKVGRRYGLRAERGSRLQVRAVLRAVDESVTYLPFSTRIGPKARSGYLNVMGGASDWINVYGAKSVADIQEAYAKAASNDQVLFNLRLRSNGGKVIVASEEQAAVVTGRKGYFVDLDGGRGGAQCRGC